MRFFRFSLFLSIAVMSTTIKASNAYIPDNISLSQIAMLGAHNAFTSTSHGWAYGQQSKSIFSLLNKYEIRYLKIPVHFYHHKSATRKIKKILGLKKGKRPPVLALCHEGAGGNCSVTMLQRLGRKPQLLVDLLKSVAKFNKKHPKEVVMIVVEGYLGKRGRNNKNRAGNYSDAEAAKIFDAVVKESGLGNKIYKAKKLPTMGQLRKSKKTILLVSSNGNAIVKESKYLSTSNNINFSHWSEEKRKVCDMFGNISKEAQTRIVVNPEASIDKNTAIGRAVSALNGIRKKMGKKPLEISGFKIDSSNYKKVNNADAIRKHLALCRKKHSFIKGFVLSTDFAHKGNLVDVVNEHNILLSAQNKKAQ